MHHGRVIASTKVTTYFTQTESRVLPCEIHPDLPRKGDGLVSSFGKEVRDPQTIVVADGVENVLNGGGASRCTDFLFTDGLLAEFEIDGPVFQKSETLKLRDGTLKLPDVRIEA